MNPDPDLIDGKIPKCSVMPRLCLGKLLQFSAVVTSSKIKLFTAECHLLLTGKARSNNYTGHIIIMNGAFHLQIQKCCAEVVSLSPVEGGWKRGKDREKRDECMDKRASPGRTVAKGWMGLSYPKLYCCIFSYRLHTQFSRKGFHIVRCLSKHMQNSSSW